MSLYGPRIHLPKVDLPSPSAPSWNFDKEKKLFLALGAIIIVLVAIVLLGPVLIQGVGEVITNILNPAVTVTWSNNPLDLTKGVREANMDITFTNTTKATTDILFNINTNSNEIIIFCPNSIYDTNKSAYVLTNVDPAKNRKIPCIVRRNTSEAVFSGGYDIEITTNLGNAKTTLQIISK